MNSAEVEEMARIRAAALKKIRARVAEPNEQNQDCVEACCGSAGIQVTILCQ